MTLALLVVVVAACTNPDVTRCGGLVCPTTSLCVADACIPSDRLAACAAAERGAPCAAKDLADGVCAGVEPLACVPRGCGNSVVEADEICDDGNQLDGDGCAAACNSTEICGDGVINAGEQCDCGTDPLALATGCPTVNSDEPGAPCRIDCSLRSCGDGVVDGLEDCEPTEAVAAQCTDLGFYDGTLACSSFCRFDVSGCVGECGNGVIEELERCDGADFGAHTSCTDVGFYRGSLGCNAVCNFVTGSTGCSGICGDGVRDDDAPLGPEGCDAPDVPTCAALGFHGPGTVACQTGCTLDFEACERCGDGVFQSAFEGCEGTELDGNTCETFGLTTRPGTSGLACTPVTCSFDIAGCVDCGDPVVCDCGGCAGNRCCCEFQPGVGACVKRCTLPNEPCIVF